MKRTTKKKLASAFQSCLILGMILMVTFFVFIRDGVSSAGKQQREIEALRNELQQEKDRAKELEAMQEYAKTDRYTETVARDMLGLAKPNDLLLKPEN